MLNVLYALFLVAHGMIHLGYLTPPPDDPNYPFRLEKSWLIAQLGVSADIVHAVGKLLAVVAVIGFMLAGLSTAKVIVPHGWQDALIGGSAAASLLLLIVGWHSWLVLGVGINLALLFAALR